MSRIESVDAFRVIAILAVIAIHTHPFHVPGTRASDLAEPGVQVNQFARFAVPFFFVVSGYFWGAKIRAGHDVIQLSMNMSRRIAMIFCAWCLIYLFIDTLSSLLPWNIDYAFQHGRFGPIKVMYWKLISYFSDPVSLVFQGTKAHLWFLMSLICCLAVSAAMIARNHLNSLILVSVALYTIGLLGNAYASTPMGIHISFDTRNGPFFGLVLFVTGYALSRMEPNATWLPTGLALFIAGVALHFTEIALLHRKFGTILEQDYVVGTYPMGLGAALMALSNASVLRFPPLSSMGHIVLGIYLVHVVFVDLLRPIGGLSMPSPWEHAWPIAYVLLVFALSVTTVRAMSRNKLTNSLVT